MSISTQEITVQALTEDVPVAEAPDGRLTDLFQSVLPVWLGQIEMARGHVEDSALNLVNHFINIAGRIDQIAKTLAGAESAAAALANPPTPSSGPDTGVIGNVRIDRAPLDEYFRILQKEREAISQAVHMGIVALQFQDRVNQVLNSVRGDLEKLKQRIDKEGNLPDSFNVGDWLDELLRSYSMTQQHVVHHGGLPPAVGDFEDVTLF